jgi:hypothetical protein
MWPKEKHNHQVQYKVDNCLFHKLHRKPYNVINGVDEQFLLMSNTLLENRLHHTGVFLILHCTVCTEFCVIHNYNVLQIDCVLHKCHV